MSPSNQPSKRQPSSSKVGMFVSINIEFSGKVTVCGTVPCSLAKLTVYCTVATVHFAVRTTFFFTVYSPATTSVSPSSQPPKAKPSAASPGNCSAVNLSFSFTMIPFLNWSGKVPRSVWKVTLKVVCVCCSGFVGLVGFVGFVVVPPPEPLSPPVPPFVGSVGFVGLVGMNASGELSEPLLQETIAKERTKIPASKAANNFARLFIILPPTRDMTNAIFPKHIATFNYTLLLEKCNKFNENLPLSI